MATSNQKHLIPQKRKLVPIPEGTTYLDWKGVDTKNPKMSLAKVEGRKYFIKKSSIDRMPIHPKSHDPQSETHSMVAEWYLVPKDTFDEYIRFVHAPSDSKYVVVSQNIINNTRSNT